MSDRHIDEPPHPRAARSRARLTAGLAGRLAAIGLMVTGSVVMGLATVAGPATPSGEFRLAGDQTLVPLPVGSECDDVTLPAIVTTVSLPSLPEVPTCTSTHTTAPTSEDVQSEAVTTSSGSSASHAGTTSRVDSRSSITTARPGSSSTASSTESKTTAGVLGANAGTPSTGTDIAFGIGIGLVIAGAGIGTGTSAFLKRRRSTR